MAKKRSKGKDAPATREWIGVFHPEFVEDPIVEEIRQHRKAHVAEHGNDLGRIVQLLRKRERESDRPRLNPRPKKRLSPIDG